MLICNNCNTVNDDNCQKCNHCQMSGNFRRQMGDNKSDNTPILRVKVLCRNCGSDAPGEGTKCAHCRFPMARPVSVEYRSTPKMAEVSSAIPLNEKQQ